jgi:hypothetical protein
METDEAEQGDTPTEAAMADTVIEPEETEKGDTPMQATITEADLGDLGEARRNVGGVHARELNAKALSREAVVSFLRRSSGGDRHFALCFLQVFLTFESGAPKFRGPFIPFWALPKIEHPKRGACHHQVSLPMATGLPTPKGLPPSSEPANWLRGLPCLKSLPPYQGPANIDTACQWLRGLAFGLPAPAITDTACHYQEGGLAWPANPCQYPHGLPMSTRPAIITRAGQWLRACQIQGDFATTLACFCTNGLNSPLLACLELICTL